MWWKLLLEPKFPHLSIPRLHFFLTYQLHIQTEQLKSVSKYGYSVDLSVDYASFVKLQHFEV